MSSGILQRPKKTLRFSGEIRAKGTLKKGFLPPRWRLNKKTREKVVPYPRFLSLLLEYMEPNYKNEELIVNPTEFSTHVDTEMHKKDLQAAGNPTSLGVASEEGGANPQLSSAGVSAASELQRKYTKCLLHEMFTTASAKLRLLVQKLILLVEVKTASTKLILLKKVKTAGENILSKKIRDLEVKARSTLMMGIPNEHQLNFNSIKDAKKLLEAVEKKFGGNAATKKTQRNLLKQQYENFTTSSSKMLDQTFDNIQKLVIQLELLEEKISQEDVNQKLLRSLLAEWNTHVYEPEVKGMSVSSLSTQNMDFVSSLNNNTSSTNGAVNTAHGVSPASTQVNAANSTNIDNLNGMKEMDLRWQMAMWTMRARRFLKKTRRKLTINGNKTIGFDKSNVECYNCHKRGHFTRECRALRNQDNKHKESSRRSVHVEISASTALVSCDGLGGYDWSDQAEEGPNYALMAFLSSSFNSEVSNDSSCSKSCLEIVKLLKTQNYQLLKDIKKSKLIVLGYKTGLKLVEEILELYKTNESIYLEDIRVLKVEIQIGEIAIRELKKKLEIAQKEKDGIQLNVDKFEHASKRLNKLVECQIVDNCKKRLGYKNYNAVPPPYIGNFMPLTPDLSFTGLDEFVNKHVVENCKAKSSEEKTKVVRKNNDAPIIEKWVSDNKEEDMSQPKIKKKIVRPSVAKIEFVKSKQQGKTFKQGNPQMDLQDQRVINNGCTRYMTWNMSYLTDYKEIDEGYVTFGRNPKGGKITEKAAKDETSGILKSFIIRIENLVDHKVKVIRCDNGTEFKNREMNQFCEIKGILRQFSVARTPKQNKVAKRRNMTLIEAVRTMLADSNKAFRVFNTRTKIVEENLHIRFSESTPNIVGSGPDWLFDIDALTRTMNYEPITADPPFSEDPKSSNDDGSKPLSDDRKKVDEDPRKVNECNDQEKEDNVNSTNNVNTVSSTVNAPGTNEDNELLFDPNMPALEDVSTFDFLRNNEYAGVVDDINNLDTTIQVGPIPTTRIHKDYPLNQVIRDLQSATQTRKMSKSLKEHGFVSTIQQRTNHKDLQNCLFACFLSHEEPKKVIHALKDPSWIKAIHEELLQFKLQEIWTLVDLPNRKRAIGTKWVLKNKNDERGIVIRNKARLLKIKEEVYVCQPPGFEDPNFAYRVYKVVKALYRLHQALRAWFTEVKTASTPMETQKPLLKDEDGEEVDVHMQGQPKLGLWYPKDSPFDLVAYIDSDYAGASLDRKSTTGGYQFLECRLIS
uniref:Uncharacterized protein n=1 Tax=Tanacetum cinerariifolium TaxID=118510 RepID=A0A6L2LKN2_TANCI|nr:hypothetical protein [Tanacetum cinerariifolium]